MAAFTQAQLDSLRAAYARGITRIQYDGQTVEYASMQEMERAIARMENDLAPVKQDKFTLASFSRL